MENGSLINVESIAECSKGSSGHLKIDKTKVLMENGSLMMVESVAEYSKGSSDHCKIDKTNVLMEKVDKWRSKVLQNAPLGAFCNTFELHLAVIIGIVKPFLVFFLSGHFRQVLL